jgi:hypothetical protein
MKDFDDDSWSPLFVMVVVSFIAVIWLGIYMESEFLTLIGTIASVFTAVMAAKISAGKHMREDLYNMRKRRYDELVLPLFECDGSEEEIEAILAKTKACPPRNLESKWKKYRKTTNVKTKERLRCEFIDDLKQAERAFRNKGNFGIQDGFIPGNRIERALLLPALVCFILILTSFAVGYALTDTWWFPYGRATFFVFGAVCVSLLITFVLYRIANFLPQLAEYMRPKKKKPDNPDIAS